MFSRTLLDRQVWKADGNHSHRYEVDELDIKDGATTEIYKDRLADRMPSINTTESGMSSVDTITQSLPNLATETTSSAPSDNLKGLKAAGRSAGESTETQYLVKKRRLEVDLVENPDDIEKLRARINELEDTLDRLTDLMPRLRRKQN